jgi:hypothetical protein
MVVVSKFEGLKKKISGIDAHQNQSPFSNTEKPWPDSLALAFQTHKPGQSH